MKFSFSRIFWCENPCTYIVFFLVGVEGTQDLLFFDGGGLVGSSNQYCRVSIYVIACQKSQKLPELIDGCVISHNSHKLH